MSGSLNKVMLIGNLGRDPELKVTAQGTPVARFSLATTETWRNAQGEKQSKTEWHNVVIWGKQAETAEKFLRKGKQIMVEGKIQYREYTDQAGVKKTACDIRCENFVMLGRADEGAPREGGYSSPRSHAPESFEDHAPPPAAANYDDDIPF
ncbi:MAG: single-stranded DNA-binding protein [Acidobacteria bacterium]|nr:single-stranded DNA-binding protein [Acidobacteriota bacterium]